MQAGGGKRLRGARGCGAGWGRGCGRGCVALRSSPFPPGRVLRGSLCAAAQTPRAVPEPEPTRRWEVPRLFIAFICIIFYKPDRILYGRLKIPDNVHSDAGIIYSLVLFCLQSFKRCKCYNFAVLKEITTFIKRCVRGFRLYLNFNVK